MRRIIERLEAIGLGDRIWTAAVTVSAHTPTLDMEHSHLGRCDCGGD